MRATFLALCITAACPIHAQETDTIMDLVDPMILPTFPGGEPAMYAYIRSRIDTASVGAGSGKVFVVFTVCSDGSLEEVHVGKGVSPSLDKEALRIVSNMPRWAPATWSGKAVDVRMVLPINFK